MRTIGVTCPVCGSSNVELVSAWGGQLITSHMRCDECWNYFEAVREHFGQAQDDEKREDRP